MPNKRKNVTISIYKKKSLLQEKLESFKEFGKNLLEAIISYEYEDLKPKQKRVR